MTREYTFRVTEVVRVVDGDTYWLRVDVGFRHTALVNIRLAGYDTPELNSGSPSERERGKVARKRAADWFAAVLDDNLGPLWVRTDPDPDSFGRWLGEVWLEYHGKMLLLGEELRSQDLASVWPTRWRDEFDLEEAGE